jgi:DNA processing protein
MEMLYEIALTLVPGVGDVLARRLISHCGSAEAVFKEKKHYLMLIQGIGEFVASNIKQNNYLERAAKEIEFTQKYKIQILYYQHTDYPSRLRHCTDAPVVLYYKGSASLNPRYCLSIVGTRRATDYGRDYIARLMDFLKNYEVLIVSGLAFGIDTAAHRSALDAGLSTVAVLGHGLDRIYPSQNRTLAKRMLDHGGLLSDFPSGTNPDRENFPKRNRIIAGMADATLVIETGMRGGSLITADIANSYNRDVFALPGRFGDTLSEGCNWLIRTNRAALLDSPENLVEELGWAAPDHQTSPTQKKLFIDLSPDETRVVEILQALGTASIDRICIDSQLPATRVAAALLNLELNGLLRCMPGKIYKLT